MSPSDLPALLTSLWQPAHFYLAGGLRCAWQFEAEQMLPWEHFRGRLLEPRQSRMARTFLAWNVLPVENGAIVAEPILSMLLDETEKTIHVTRGVRCRVWRPVDAAGGIESEQTIAWVRELVGTLRLGDAASRESLIAAVQSLIGQAIVGTSRLPLTSLEAPLPQFTFGELAYVPRATLEGVDPRLPRRTWRALIEASPAEQLDEGARAKLLEVLLRSVEGDAISEVAQATADWLGANRLAATFRRMFNDVSLSPYTEFVDRALALLAKWAEGPLTAADEIDLLSSLLRQITRHLTAYDLILFHYRGANFPDALLLDALLCRLFDRADIRPDLFHDPSRAGRQRRRALRMGCLLRSHYEGHAVPDQPTSPGENIRVLPAPFDPVPDEQIDQPHRRGRRLYNDAPLAGLMTPVRREIVAHALRDLADDAELREGGIGLFIDRPLGFFKAPAEIDQTPLLSYEAFSRRLATRSLLDTERLATGLGLDVSPALWSECRERFLAMKVAGLSADRIPEPRRPSVSLADARKVADDFVFARATPRSLRAFWGALGVEPAAWPLVARIVTDAGETTMAAFDESGRVCVEFEGDWSQGSLVRGGVEIPRAGLRWVKARAD
jgi:hypothetical protein